MKDIFGRKEVNGDEFEILLTTKLKFTLMKKRVIFF